MSSDQESPAEAAPLTPELEALARRILDAGAISFRDVDGGEEPFVYSTGNRGPGYVQIKGLVGRPALLQELVSALADRVAAATDCEVVNGNATGGIVPGWELRRQLSERLGRELPFCYLRGARKPGGHGELITGDRANPEIRRGMKVLIVEELVNYAGTLVNATLEYRAAGYRVTHGACILTYDQPEARRRLAEAEVELVPLLTLPQLLAVGEASGQLQPRNLGCYRDFLANPVRWQLDRGYPVPETALGAATDQGWNLQPLDPNEALEAGAPPAQIQAGVRYYMGAA